MFSEKLFDGGLFNGGLFSTNPLFGDTAPPPEPTPWDRQLPDPDGMDGYETTFPTAVIGGVLIGITGKINVPATPLDFTVLVDDVPVEVVAFSGGTQERTSFCYIGCVEDLPIGTHTLKIVMNGGSSAGTAALRIVETDPMPVGWKGATNAAWGSGTSNGVAVGLTGSQIGSTILLMAAWNDYRAYPPSCSMRISADNYQPQQTVRVDLIRNTVSSGFFRATSINASPYFSLRAANPSNNWSVALAELRGVTIRS